MMAGQRTFGSRVRVVGCRVGAVATTVALAMVIVVPAGSAAPGDLDPTFGDGGIVRTHVGDHGPGGLNYPFPEARGLVVQADGKIVAAGPAYDAAGNHAFGVVRYGSDGTLDSSFGDGGVVRTQAADPGLSYSWSDAGDVAVQADGKIIVVGAAGDAAGDRVFAVVRYEVDGRLDVSFGDGGIVRAQASDPAVADPSSRARGVAVQEDGKIVAAGEARAATYRDAFAVVRYEVDGSLDTSFGDNGVVLTQVGSWASWAYAVVVQADGKIVTAGGAYDAAGNHAFGVVRHEVDGSLDASFGDGGIVRTQPTVPAGAHQYTRAEAVVVQADGKIIVAGQTDDPWIDRVFAVVRYEVDGALDASFGDGGIVRTQVADFWSRGATSEFGGVVVQADGKIVVAGATFDATGDWVFGVVRYESNGRVDTSFGDGGIVHTQADGHAAPWQASGATSLALQADGKIVAAGWAHSASGDHLFAVVRYLNRELPSDEVSVSLSSPFGYANAGTITAGDLSVVQDEQGVKAVTGSGRLPASPGLGDTAVSFDVRRITIFFFRVYVGSVGVVDASADINQTTVQLFGTVSPVGANGAQGRATWFTFQPAFGIYTLNWSVTDNA